MCRLTFKYKVELFQSSMFMSLPKPSRHPIRNQRVSRSSDIRQFLQRQWFFRCLCFCLWESPLALQQPSPGPSHGLPSYSLPSQKKRKENGKEDRITLKNPCKYKKKREKQTQIQLQLCECIWILAWVRMRKR